jgi:hypothetical protein
VGWAIARLDRAGGLAQGFENLFAGVAPLDGGSHGREAEQQQEADREEGFRDHRQHDGNYAAYSARRKGPAAFGGHEPGVGECRKSDRSFSSRIGNYGQEKIDRTVCV